MKIALDVSQTCTERAGCAWHADSLAQAFAEFRPASELLLYHRFGRWITQTRKGTQIDGLDAPFLTMDKSEASELWQRIALGKSPLPGKPDIVQSTSYMAPKTPGAKLVYTVHDLCFWTHPEFSTFANAQLCQAEVLAAMQHADAFHFVSQASKADFDTVFPGWLEQTRRPALVARSGPRLKPSRTIDPYDRFDSSLSPWLHVGTIEPRKNLDALLDAYEIYCEKSQQRRPLIIAGSRGWHSDVTHDRIARLSRSLPVKSLGYVDEPTLKQLYETAFALTFPSHYEGFGLPLIEALCFGLPVLANPIPAALEFNEPTWFWSDFSDPTESANQMVAIENLPRSNYADRAKQAARRGQCLDWKQTAASLYAFYQEILSADKHPVSATR